MRTASRRVFVRDSQGRNRTGISVVAPTGRAVELRWAAVYVTDGDRLKSEHPFFDQMDFLGQLGLSPAEPEACMAGRSGALTGAGAAGG